MIVNKYKGSCTCCQTALIANQGFVFKNEQGKYVAVCQGRMCVEKTCPPEEIKSYERHMERMQVRTLTADGTVDMPYELETLALVRAMPGAKFDYEGDKRWHVSMDQKDRRRVLELARKMRLDVDPSLETVKISDRVKELKEQLKTSKLYGYQKEGVLWIAEQDSCLLADEMGLGKAQPLDAKILTPNGWIRMGDVKVGTRVIGSDGEPCKVVSVYPQGIKEVYKVTFSDDSQTECCEDHLWEIQTPNDRFREGKGRVLSLSNLIDKGVKYANGNSKFFIPIVFPVSFDNTREVLSLDPYLLGCLLGDGTMSGGTPGFSSGDEEMHNAVESLLPEGTRLSWSHGDSVVDCRIVGEDKNLVTEALRGFSLMGKCSHEKFVPNCYKFSSIEDRVSILQGLMDTDGSILNDVIEYSSASIQLAQDLREIVWSLGGTSTFKERRTFYTYKGEKKEGKTSYRLVLSIPPGINPFRLKRKSSLYKDRSKYPPYRAIKNIELVGEKECQCIKIDRENGLYVTNDYIVTHNTPTVLVSMNESFGHLIVCPTEVLYNWKIEGGVWRLDLKYTIVKRAKDFVIPAPGEVVIISYGMLPTWVAPKKGKRKNHDITKEQVDTLADCVVVYDEIHKCSNNKTKRSRLCKYLTRWCHHAIGMTGTPVRNKEMELWSVFQVLGLAQSVFDSFMSFIKMMDGEKGKYGYEFNGNIRSDVPERMRRVMLRRLKKDVKKDLPDKVYRPIFIDTDQRIKSELDSAWKVYEQSKEFREGKIPDFTEMSAMKAAIAVSHIPVMLETVASYEASDTPLIVVSCHRDPIEKLRGRPGWKVIMGGMSAKDKQAVVEEWQAGKLKGLGVTLKAASTGVTLTYGADVLRVDVDWVPSNNAQFEDRIHRIGQTKLCVYMDIISDHPLLRHIHKLNHKKMKLAHKSMEKLIGQIATKVDAKEALEDTEEDFNARLAKSKGAAKDKERTAILRHMESWNVRFEIDESRVISEENAGVIREAANTMMAIGQQPRVRRRGEVVGGSTFASSHKQIIDLLHHAGLETNGELLLAESILKQYENELGKDHPTLFKKSA